MESIQQNLVAEELSDVVTTTTDEQHTDVWGEGSLFTRSQNEILELIFSIAYRAPENDISFDVHSLFSTSENIIAFSVQLIDHIALKKRKGIDFYLVTPKERFNSTLCNLIKSFGCEISCKCPGDEVAFEERTREILTKLASYQCEQQVVLTLAAFVLEYEDSKQFDKLCAIFNQEPVVNRPANMQMIREDRVIELNNLIKATLEVIQHILELEKLTSTQDYTPQLDIAIMDAPFNVYWSIITLVACGTEVTHFTAGDEDINKLYDLSQFSEKINFVLNKLKGQLAICQQEKEVANAKYEFGDLVKSASNNITDLFKNLVLFKHKAYPQHPMISVGCTNNEVFDINVLQGKSVLFFISSLDNIIDTDISTLKEIDECIKETNRNCKVVWIPIVEDWTKEGVENKFKERRSKMPCYAVQYFSPPAIGYLHDRWGFNGNPMSVLMNKEGKVAAKGVLELFRTRGEEAIDARFIFPENKDKPVVFRASVKVFEFLIFPDDKLPHMIFDGFTKKKVDVKLLQWKKLFLFFSGLDSLKLPHYISCLRSTVYQKIQNKIDYKIVWIPVVKEQKETNQKQFMEWRAKMPWYSLDSLAPIAGIKEIRDKWNFKDNKAMVVLLNTQGQCEYTRVLDSTLKPVIANFPLVEELEKNYSWSF